MNAKVVYTDRSKLKRLWLEDSFLPGALRKSTDVTFRGAAQFHSHTRDDPLPAQSIRIPAVPCVIEDLDPRRFK